MGQKTITKNTLFYGDNLIVMRQYIADESIDLIYLDPPFNSNRNYNVLYKDESGLDSEAQILAFEDTWHWTRATDDQYHALAAVGDKAGRALENLVDAMGRNQMTAYLVMMTARLVELHRILKPTGCLYLHCDPTASHYLKMILDMIFGVENFQNEIVWKRTHAHNDPQRFGRNSDRLLFYGKTNKIFFNPVYLPYEESYLQNFFRGKDDKGIYRLVVLTGPKISSGESDSEWRGYRPSQSGRSWSVPKRIVNTLVGEQMAKSMSIVEKLDLLDQHGYIVFSKNGIPSFKQYLHEMEGAPAQELWSDINPISSQAAERLGYPTQKPLALLERIIQASSNPGDVVLDPFCGCGTAVHAAQKLGRTWIGIDVTYLATTIIKSRLYDAFEIEAKKDYNLIGEPTTLTEARHLATQDRYQFQWWALGLIPARPQGGQGDSKTGKKGKDRGIDGIMTFQDDPKGHHKRIIIQVKSGKVKSGDIRDLIGTVTRENAVMGVFVTLEPPSRDMEMEALSIPKWHSDTFDRDYPKIQILTIEELLNGAKVQFPGTDTTLSKAQREQDRIGEQGALL